MENTSGRKPVLNIELQGQDEIELASLYALISLELVRTDRGSSERRNALATQENISRERVNFVTRHFNVGTGHEKP